MATAVTRSPRRPPGDAGRRSWLTPTLDELYLLIVLAAVLGRALATPVAANDFWFHAATGRLIAATGSVPTHDMFSFTQAGAPFFNQSWLAQLAFFWLHELGGIPAVLSAHAIAITGAFGILVALCRSLGASRRLTAATVGLVAFALAMMNFGVRPQAYAFPLFVMTLWIVWGARAQAARGGATWRLWLLPLVMVVWVNTHGSYPLLFAIAVAALAGDAVARRTAQATPRAFDLRLALAAAAAGVASLLNPGGWRVWGYVIDLSRNPVVTELIGEWSSPSVREFTGLAFVLASLAVAVTLFVNRRRTDPADALLAAGFLLIGAIAVRNVAWFGFVAALVLTRAYPGRLPDRPPRAQGAPALNSTVGAVIVLLVVLALPWVRPHVFGGQLGDLLNQRTPVDGVEALTQLGDPPTRLFHELSYGSYLIWSAPDIPVFIDPRIELYPRGLAEDYLALSAGHDVVRLLNRHAIDGVLADRDLQAPLERALRRHGGWDVVHEDGTSILFLPSQG